MAQVAPGEKVHARLIAERDAVAPGGTVTVAVELDTRKDWHTYWRNAGEAGAATEIHWTLPPGWSAGPIQWPYPQSEAVGPIMDYGYEGKPWLLVDIHAPKDAAASGTVVLKAAVQLLVCAEVCVPEDKDLSLQLGVGEPSLPPDPAFAAARAKLPVPSPWPMRYRLKDSLDLFVETPSLAAAHPAKAEFFPFQPGMLNKGVWTQDASYTQNGLILHLQPGQKLKDKGGALEGVLVLTSADGSVQALNVHALPGDVPDAGFAGGAAMELWLALLFAFIGGLILNLMPCVLPILAMKALALASHARRWTPCRARRTGLRHRRDPELRSAWRRAGGAARRRRCDRLGLPAAGADRGRGLRASDLRGGTQSLRRVRGARVRRRRCADAQERCGVGAFFTGVLAVAVAAPCTAPFMAAALGYALTQPTAVALAVFVALGLGFAAPFIAIGFSPRLLRMIPAPGVWMLRLKQAFAFPMYAASVWLVWVLANEAGADSVAATLGAMVTFALAVWIWTASRNAGPRGRGFGAFATLLAFLATLALLATLLRATPAPAMMRAEGSGIPHEAYSAARLDALRKEGRPVFINATAAWCITCLVNERVAFSSGAVREAFAKNHVACLIADWTRRDPEITRLLEAHGRDGVPLYLYYAPGAPDAKVLPQILTESAVLSAVNAR